MPASNQLLRPYRPRTKTGCFCCRLRRKKCDEVRPVCTGCQRVDLVCSWPQGEDQNGTANEFAWRRRLLSLVGPGPVDRTTDMSTLLDPEASPDRSHDLTRPLHIARKSGVVSSTSEDLELRLISNPSTASLIVQNEPLRIIYEHFIHVTVHRLPVATFVRNPFVTHMIPLAQSEGLIMHCMLALSGAHLCCKGTTASISTAAWSTLALALRSVKHLITRKVQGDEVDTTCLLLSIMLLCQAERLSGSNNWAMFHHLRAIQSLIMSELEPSVPHRKSELFGVVLEMYAYIELVSRCTFHSLPDSDGFVDSYISRVLELVGNYDTCGVMFGFAYDVFSLIPRVCNLRRARLVQLEQGDCSDQNLALCHQQLEQTILSWRPPLEDIPDDDAPEAEYPHLLMVAQIYHLAVLIFLHASFYVSPTELDVLEAKIENPVSEMFPMLNILSMTVSTTMLWPLMILGSCLRDPELQQGLQRMLQNDPLCGMIAKLASRLLEWVWEDDTLFGPLGLDSVVKRHAVDFCFT